MLKKMIDKYTTQTEREDAQKGNDAGGQRDNNILV